MHWVHRKGSLMWHAYKKGKRTGAHVVRFAKLYVARSPLVRNDDGFMTREATSCTTLAKAKRYVERNFI